MKTPLICLFLALTIAGASAETFSFPERNFTITAPSSWKQLPPPIPEVAIVLESADAASTAFIATATIPDNELPQAAGEMLGGIRTSITSNGWTTEPARMETIGTRPFLSMKGRQGDKSLISYVTVAGNEAYALQFVGPGPDLSAHPEFRGILESFRLIEDRPAQVSLPAEKSAAYNMGYAVGRVFGMALVPTLLIGVPLLIWFFWRRRNKRGHRRRRRY